MFIASSVLLAGQGFPYCFAPWLVPALIAGGITLVLLMVIGATGFEVEDEDVIAGTTGFGTAVTVGDGAAARSAVAEVVSAAAEAVSVEEAPVEIGNRLELTAEEQQQITLAVQTAERRTKGGDCSDDCYPVRVVSRSLTLGRSRTCAPGARHSAHD